MSELKPCPWCPVEPRIRHNRNGIGSEAAARKLPELWEVSCAHAERHGRTYGKTRDEAIGAWNRRTHQPVTPAMVERLEATIDRIEELKARQDERKRKLDLAVTHVVDGESFICYLIDNCEREVIHEESLHEWLADFLKNPRYHKPVTPVEFTESCGCVFCDLKCPHSEEDCKLIALLEDVAVQHEGLENYGDSCGPRMCIRACRGAIAALKAAHPQPVTPAGGEVECAGTNCHASGANGHKHSTECRFEYASAAASGVKSVTVGVKVDDSVDQIEWRGSIIDLSHPPVSDAALVALREIAAMCPATCEMTNEHAMAQIAADAIAALNQRGG